MTPVQRHEWLAAYNWDDGLAPVWPIVDDATTEVATALMIYWRIGGPWLESDAGGVNTEAKRLQDTVRARLLSGYYTSGALRFDPADELSPVQLYKFRRVGVPEVLLTSTN